MNVAKRSLPQGWANAKLNDISLLRYEKVEPSGLKKKAYISLEHIESETNRIIDHGYSEDVKSLKSIFYAGDVLYGKLRPYLNKVCQPNFDGVCSTDILVFKQSPALDNRLLLQLLSRRETVKYANAHVKGINLPRISAYQLGELNIDLPPLNEQKRIVTIIEELQGRSRRAKEAMEGIPELLEQLRRSILAAAYRGNLTKEWREKHPDVEPANELLKRIRAERRKRWEEAEFEKLKAKGLTGDTLNEEFAKRRKQCKEPAPLDTSDLPELPKDWCWASIEELSQWITDGTHQPPPFTDRGVPFLVISNMVSGDIAWDTVQKWVSTETYDKYTGIYKPSFGDIIYSTVGSYGVAVEVMTHKKFMFQRHIAHIRPISNHVSVSYLSFSLNSPICKEQADKVARGVAQKTVNLSDLRRFAIPLAPLSEQYKLNELLSKSFEILDNQRLNLNSSLTKLYNFEQSILSKAFRGELVPQDPNDEPASILLERIRQEKARVAAQPKAKDKRKGKTRILTRLPRNRSGKAL